MRLRDYLYEQAETLLLWVFGMLVLGGFLWVTGTEIPVVLCVEGVWFFVTLLSHGRKYLALKQRYQRWNRPLRCWKKIFVYRGTSQTQYFGGTIIFFLFQRI